MPDPRPLPPGRFFSALLLCAWALLPLAGCTMVQGQGQEEGNIIAPGNFRAGSGMIESISVLPRARPANAPASANPQGRIPDPNLYRLFINMQNGGSQVVDIDNPTFLVGETVELTNDGRIVHVSGSTLFVR